MHKKIASVVATAVLLVTMSTTSVIASPLSDKLKQQQNSLQQNQINYKNAQDKVSALNSKIESYDNQIENLMREIEANKSKISSLQTDINKSQKDIQKAKADIKEEQELYNQRMRTMYMNGGVGGYLDVILGAENLGDLCQKVQAVKRISDLDKKIVKQLRTKQADLQQKQDKLKAEQNKVVTLNKAQEEKVKKCEQDKKAQDAIILQAKKEEALYAGKLQTDQAQINSTMKAIEQMRQQAAASASVAPVATKSSTSSSSSSRAQVSSSQASKPASRPASRPSRGSSAPASGNAIVSYAYNFLGVPYKWAANGPNSFDCSGFTCYVYAHFGIGLPRTSGSQSGTGSYVSRNSLQPGDLVFFGSPVHHVGIYVGGGCYIHAPRTGDVVKVSSLSGRSDYACARRVM
ncbi:MULTISPECIES: C40 family peptidase [Clostridium]|uniref:NLP/P60 family protein n=1 Tax=Clostridium novyi (strain NT) TaxID=386415 RepID=A0Q3L5_CLONN|nr:MULTISPECIES: NlpC/P60 family protein [Clostridium]ABK61532.1 NLP/P60 family protein [Clostridium novyi NT]KEH86610.1 glycoside hydrolase [Clostridium novyi A str. NCTC 538]KEH89196.1 glycoside hydrolase [Clostridium novyi A str. 4540]KEH90297.1 glycoside hydrolase [Clostridium novyi A str. BKT29909]KEH94107.1 glycoside hydrolase [Clostridium botulinum C/D str. It1]